MGLEAEDLLGDGRLLKSVVAEGDGPCPKSGKRVEVHYETEVVGTGVKIDSSRDRDEPFDFVLGEGDVLEAWDLGVATMRPGETSEFVVDPSLAYGEDGAGDDIPAGAVLKFTIELISGKAQAAPLKEAATRAVPGEPQRLQRATECKDMGNALIKECDFGRARDAYTESLAVLRGWRGTELEQLREKNKLKLSCLLNLAQCGIRLEDYQAAAKHASDALEIEPHNCKALYRRGMARMSCGSLHEGRADLLEASKLDPRNVEVRRKLEECKRKIACSSVWHKGAFGGMFGKAVEQQDQPAHALDSLPRVWLDIRIGGREVQRIKIALYSDTAPRAAENFRALCTGERGLGKCGQPLHLKSTVVHRIVPRNLIEAGDVENYNGTGGESIYGPTFPDEGFLDAHHKRGLLSMANTGPDTNNSKFLFTLRSLPQFDGKRTVFGEVVSGMQVLNAVEEVETEYPDRPTIQVAIVESGQG